MCPAGGKVSKLIRLHGGYIHFEQWISGQFYPRAMADGWIMNGVTKKTVNPLKRKTPNVDLRTFSPRPFEHSFDGWLADSTQVWNQLRFELRVKRQIKKRRTRL